MKGTKTGLFLIELMISLLLFAFCAAICMQLFHASNKRTESAEDLSKAVFQATTVAEIYKASGGDLEAVAEYYGEPLAAVLGDSAMFFFDEDWNLEANHTYSSTFHTSGYRVGVVENTDNSADITVSKLVTTYSGKEMSSSYNDIFEITVKAVV